MSLPSMAVVVGVVYTLYQVHAVAGGCPSIFSDFNMGCYYVGQNAVPSADIALATCTGLGGYLLNVDAELEYNHVVSLIKASSPRLYDGYWIGATFNTDMDYWVWQKTDSSSNLVSRYMDPQAGYYNWGPGEPAQDWPWMKEYHVAVMVRRVAKPWKWYSMDPSLHTPAGMSYICEADYKQ